MTTNKNATMSKKIDDDVDVSANCDVVFFSISDQFAAIGNPDSGHMVNKTYILIVTFYLTKPENRTKKSLTQLSYYWFE